MTDTSVTPRLPDGYTIERLIDSIRDADVYLNEHGYSDTGYARIGLTATKEFLSAFLTPQPQTAPADKPETLVEETFGKTFRDRFFMNKPINHPDHPNNCTDPTWSHFYWLLRELDRRLP